MLDSSLASLESFNRHVAHDLRAPVANLAQLSRLSSSALERGDLGFVARALATMAEQAEHAVELMADLLMLSQEGDASLPVETVAVETVVQAALDGLPGLKAQPACRLIVGPLPRVRAHACLLRQVFVNLLGNALKFAGQRAITVVRIDASTRQSEHVFHVRDNGIGFDPKDAELLFMPFQRLHGTAFAGHGLGLSIARRIVECHGGRIWCRSQPDKGTTVSFSLPRQPIESPDRSIQATQRSRELPARDLARC